jgi:hypothetical protein
MPEIESPFHRQPRENRGILLAAACGLVLTILLGLFSDGVYHDDDLTHFLMARWSAWFPAYLLHVWGRPGLTLPMAAVSWLPDSAMAWHFARALSAVVTALTALMAARLAGTIGLRHPWWVVVACYLQPLNALLAATTLSETFTAFYLIAAVCLLREKRLWFASLVFSLCLLTRHEAVVFLPLWVFALAQCDGLRWRKFVGGLLAIWAPLVHNVLHWQFFGQWPVRMFTVPHGSSEYLSTGPLAYIPDALYALTPAVACLALLGLITLVRRRVFLVPAIGAVFFLTHLTIKALGVYASGGYGRFMVAVAPFTAVMAVAGLEHLLERPTSRVSRRWAWGWLALTLAVAWLACEVERRAGRLPAMREEWVWAGRAVLGLMLVLSMIPFLLEARGTTAPFRSALLITLALASAGQGLLIVRPLRLRADQKAVNETVAWMRERNLVQRPFFATNPWFAHFLGLVENPRAYKGPVLLASMPVGTIFVWDSNYSGSDFHCMTLESYLDDPRYRLIRRSPTDDTANRTTTGLRLAVFEKMQPTPAPVDPPMPYPAVLLDDVESLRGVYYVREEDTR